ncbi:hypothetical protein CC79DRAFT_1401055 [Sarocladium strictum]
MASSHRNDAQHPETIESRPNWASPSVIVDGLRSPVDVRQRIRAINAFVKRLSRTEDFQPTWSAADGATGVAEMMTDFSVNEVHRLCRQLGRTASTVNARKERRDGFGELIAILTSEEKDSRPLEDYYQFIVPACHESVIRSWDARATTWTRMQKRWMALAHPRLCEQQFLEDLFSKSKDGAGTKDVLAQNETLLRGNTPLCQEVLRKLESLNSEDIYIPQDFIRRLVLPLLRRLEKSSSSRSTEDLRSCLDLSVRCCVKHPQHLSKGLPLHDADGFPRFVIQRWIESTGNAKAELWECLEGLYASIGPIPNLSPSQLFDLVERPYTMDDFSRYKLFCMVLKHLSPEKLSLLSDSPAPPQEKGHPESNARRSNLWPADLFLCLPLDKSLALFHRLKRQYEGQSFIQPSSDYTSTILGQEQSPSSRTADLDIVETVMRKEAQPEDQSWSTRIRAVIQTRTKTAMELREAADRGFWIKSAINLCVAAEELDLLAESLRLSRRFTRDPHFTSRAWGWDYLETDELLELLTIVPDVTYATPEEVAKLLDTLRMTVEEHMIPAHKVVLTLLRTALAAVGGPGFRDGKWNLVIGLPALIAQRRERAVRSIREKLVKIPGRAASLEQDFEAMVCEAIWKPTIEQLVEIESVMTDPAAPNPWSSKFQAPRGPLDVLMKGLPVKSPVMLAQLTRCCLTNIQAQLPPALARTHMSSIAGMTTKLAKSEQPSLALPFIQTIIQEGDYSVDHRQLLTQKLLSSLPSDTAREFLQTIVRTVADVLARQNNQAEEDTDGGDVDDEAESIEEGEGLARQNDQAEEDTDDEDLDDVDDVDDVDDEEDMDNEEEVDDETQSIEQAGSHLAENTPMPGVKVTTVKMMAQLLNGTSAVSASTSCEMLVSLLKEARHIDARIEIVRSLLGTLETPTAKPALRAMVLDIFEEHVLPIASQLHERQVVDEADWQREDETMPEVSATNPVFTLLLEGLKRKMLRPEDRARLASLVMQALEKSAQINRRWMSVFVEKNGLGKDMFQHIPVSPAHFRELISTFGQEFTEMPDSLFTMLSDAILINIQPPDSLLRVTRHVKANASLRDTNAGQHWLRQYDNPGSAAYTLGLDQALRLLSGTPVEDAESKNALQLRNLLLAAADRCIDKGDQDTVQFLVDKIAENPNRRDDTTNSGNSSRKHIVREIIFSVEQASDNGTAALSLPDMFLLQIALLKLDTWNSDFRPEEAHEPTIRAYVRQVSDLVNTLVSRSPQPYHTDFELLKRQLVASAKNIPGFARVATMLGRQYDSELVGREDVKTNASLAAYLCLELAAESLLASSLDSKDSGLVESVNVLVRDWSESDDITVKKTGLRVAKGL